MSQRLQAADDLRLRSSDGYRLLCDELFQHDGLEVVPALGDLNDNRRGFWFGEFLGHQIRTRPTVAAGILHNFPQFDRDGILTGRRAVARFVAGELKRAVTMNDAVRPNDDAVGPLAGHSVRMKHNKGAAWGLALDLELAGGWKDRQTIRNLGS